MGRRRLLWRGALFFLLTFGISLLSLATLAQKERDDRFCVACHLHEEKFTRFQAPVAQDLVGAHFHAGSSVRCIDCHGGADLPMRLQVWALAGLDTVWFFVGHYREPERMRLPLRDQDCKQCHDPIVKQTSGPFDPEGASSAGGGPFHAIREHGSLKSPCVVCHTSHTLGQPRFKFVDSKRVAPICRDCHEEFGG